MTDNTLKPQDAVIAITDDSVELELSPGNGIAIKQDGPFVQLRIVVDKEANDIILSGGVTAGLAIQLSRLAGIACANGGIDPALIGCNPEDLN